MNTKETMKEMKAVEVIGLKKSYKEHGKLVEAVKGINFSINQGEIFGLLGENGAGKSTTINMISGIITKDNGKIMLFGLDTDRKENWENIKNRMNVTSAYFGMTGILTVYQNLAIYAKIYGVKDYKKRIDELLEQFEMKDLRNKKAQTLSSGETTRLNLCKGFINTPKILLLDECTVGLDPSMAEKTRQFIKDYRKKHNATIIFTSHYMFEVEELCDRIAFMQDGQIIKVDTAENLKKSIKKQTVEMKFVKKSPEVESLLKEKNVNIISVDDDDIIIEVDTEGDSLYKLLHSLFKRGHFIQDLRINRPTLEDIFIKIANKDNSERSKVIKERRNKKFKIEE